MWASWAWQSAGQQQHPIYLTDNWAVGHFPTKNTEKKALKKIYVTIQG